MGEHKERPGILPGTVELLIERYTAARSDYEAAEAALDDLVREVARHWARIENKHPRTPNPPPRSFRGIEWNIVGDVVYVNWEDWWAYGGEDSGHFKFGTEFLIDPARLVELEALRDAEAAAEKEAEEREEAEWREKNDLAEYQRLQAKYGARGE